VSSELRVESSKMCKEFKTHPCYVDFINQLKEREEIIVQDFKLGNVGGPDSLAKTYDDLRCRNNELEFVVGLVDTIITDCEDAEKARDLKTISDDKETENEDSN
jgi:hypothetical protein